MSARSTVLAGRQAAEALMIDTARVDSLGPPVEDEDGDVTAPRTQVYLGRCKVQSLEGQEANPVAGGATYTVQRYRVDFPVGAFRPEVGQEVTITAAALDPNLAGRVFRVVALLHKTAGTAYRLAVEEGPA